MKIQIQLGLTLASASALALAAPAPGAPAKAPDANTAIATGTAAVVLASFADLNTAAANTDAVFLFLPGKDAASQSSIDAMKSAARTLAASGAKCAIFTLKQDSPDLAKMAATTPVPAVLVMVKGRSTIPVTGDITETKLIQGYVAASQVGGCCGSGGCCQ